MTSPVEPTSLKSEPIKILIVDDDVSLGAFVSRVLQQAGYACEQLVNPLKAIPLLRDGEYSLLILDHAMPGIDGLTLLERIRKESTVPVIILTGTDKSELAVRAIRLGAFDYLTKPVDEKRLLETVRQAIEPMTGRRERIAHYDIEREIGRGGMGVVYAARDPRLDRPVALKVLLPEFAADPAYELKFLGEARTAAKFSHPNIVVVYEAGRYRGQLFMAMEFVKGEPLEKLVHSRTVLPPAAVFEIGAQVASALETMHAAGMVHRDLKPANLMRTADATIKVLDFGLVRQADRVGTDETSIRRDASGTLSYLAPEVLKNGKTDARGDIYGLGIVLYELLTGVRAFESKTMMDTMFRIAEGRFTMPLAEITGVPKEGVDLLRRMTAIQPQDRMASIAEVRASLQQLRRITGDRRSLPSRSSQPT